MLIKYQTKVIKEKCILYNISIIQYIEHQFPRQNECWIQPLIRLLFIDMYHIQCFFHTQKNRIMNFILNCQDFC